MGDEQAETYLRLLAESEARRAARRSGRVSAADIARSLEQFRWAGDILVEAGVLEDDGVNRMAAELEAALLARSDMDRSRFTHRVNRILGQAAGPPDAGPPPRWWGTAQPMRVTAVGRRIGVAHDRAPSDLHLMTLVRSPDGLCITTAMRMHWPPDGSSADLEITGAGPQHLPYDQLWAADDRGTRHRLVMVGEGGPLAWHGAIVLHGTVPPDARWLDLVADGTRRLLRIDLERGDIPRPATAEPVPAVPGGERMLAAAAERILASAWDTGGPRADERLGETIRVLAAAGAIAGLATADGQSFLHVVATGMPPLPVHRRDTGFSWWVRDDAGQWHLAVETDPHARERRQVPFRLRLTPPLRARPEQVEVVVTGRLSRVRTVILVGEMPDT